MGKKTQSLPPRIPPPLTENMTLSCIIKTILLHLLQKILLEQSWKDLFLVSLAQCNISLDLADLLRTANQSSSLEMTSSLKLVHGYKLGSGASSSSSVHVMSMWEQLERFRQMQLNGTEYTCIKALILFRAGKGLVRVWLTLTWLILA